MPLFITSLRFPHRLTSSSLIVPPLQSFVACSTARLTIPHPSSRRSISPASTTFSLPLAELAELAELLLPLPLLMPPALLLPASPPPPPPPPPSPAVKISLKFRNRLSSLSLSSSSSSLLPLWLSSLSSSSPLGVLCPLPLCFCSRSSKSLLTCPPKLMLILISLHPRPTSSRKIVSRTFFRARVEGETGGGG